MGFGFANPSVSWGQGKQQLVRIGIMDTMFADFPEATQKDLLRMTASMFQMMASLACACVHVKSPMELAEQLQAGKMDLAVFAGYEFAWVEKQHNKIKPLVLAMTVYENPVAYLVVNKESTISKFSQLAGKKVALPKRSRPHSRLYLEREAKKVEGSGQTAIQIVRPKNVERGLDDILRGKVAGTVVDRASFANYKLVKPGCHRRLKVVKISPKFPSTLIVYRNGAMTPQQLVDFRAWLLRAHTNRESKSMLDSLRLTQFRPIPKNYPQVLEAIRKTYPQSSVKSE